MPIYVYRCECGFECEVMHSMSEIDSPSEKTIEEITCHQTRMTRVPQLANLAGMVGGVSVGEKGIVRERQKEKKLRSRKHFKDEVMPTVNKRDRAHFEKKYKDL